MRAMDGASGPTVGSSRSAVSRRWGGASRSTAASSGGGSATSWSRTTRRERAADYAPFTVTSSLIPAAPASSGGESLPSDIYTGTYYAINPGIAVNNLQGLSKTMFPDSNVYDRWFGYDVGLNARLPQGIIFQGGLSTGHQTTDFCDVQDPAKAGNNALVEMLTVAGTASAVASCHMEQNWLPQIKFLGSYTIPKIDVQIGASFQSIPGVEYAATYAAPNTDVSRPVAQGGLGRLPVGGTATQTTNVALVQPGSLYGPRFNQIDARFGKVIRMGRTRAVAEPGSVQRAQLRHD